MGEDVEERSFRMPSLGADMDEGTVVEWHVKEGTPIARGAMVVSVETDKGLLDVEAFRDMVIERIVVAEGEKVPVGTVLATLRGAGPAAESAAPPPPRVISPRARRRAQEIGVDWRALAGTGSGGEVTIADVEAAAVPTKSYDTDTNETFLGRMQATIAASMSRANREIPHYYLSTTIDITPALQHLERLNAERAITDRLLLAPLIVKAIARAVEKHPEMNGVFQDGRFQPSAVANVGFAVSLRGGGLVAPALLDAGAMGVDELMKAIGALVERTRTGRVRLAEMTEGTITLTSLGERGVEHVFPIIQSPQVAIVGAGRVVERPWVVRGEVVPRRVLSLALGADHRVSDGHRGGLFLDAVSRLLEHPEAL